MSQHDYSLANQSGQSFRLDLNNALAAIVSQNSGATEPTTTYAYQWWADTTAGQLKLRNAANSAWVTVGTLASANLGLLGTSGGTLTGALLIDDAANTPGAPALAFDGDSNTGIYRSAADKLNISAGGAERVEFGTTEVVFNDGGANCDFRIEGDTDANLFVVDASADTVGIGIQSAGQQLHVHNPAASGGQIQISNTSTGALSTDGAVIGYDGSNDLIVNNRENTPFKIYTNNTERARFLAAGGLTFNGDTAAANALDDYEEGTWTPVAVNLTGSIGVNRAQYCKVGRTVFFQCYISIGSNSDSDPVLFSGLPYINNFGGSSDSWNPLMATTNRSGFNSLTGRVQAATANFEVKTQSGDTSFSWADFSGYWVIAAGSYMTNS